MDGAIDETEQTSGGHDTIEFHAQITKDGRNRVMIQVEK